MKNFRSLHVWKKSHLLVLLVYRLTKKFPKEELYGLTSQMRRSATAIPTNIAEGCGKYTQADLARYLQISLGSNQELEYLSLLSFELEYLKKDEYANLSSLVNEVKAMLIALIQKIHKEIGR